MLGDALGLGIERLRSAVLNLVSDRDASLPEKLPEGTPSEILAMLSSLAAYHNEAVRDGNVEAVLDGIVDLGYDVTVETATTNSAGWPPPPG